MLAGSLLFCFSLTAQNTFSSFSISTTGSINDIETDGMGNVFVSAPDGVWTIDLFSKAINNYGVSDGLPAIPAYSLARDNNGEVYVSTASKGLAQFDAAQNSWSSVSLGLSQSFSYFSHVSYSASGDRYLGTENGKVFIQANSTGTPTEKTTYAAAHSLGKITSISSTQNLSSPIVTVLSTNGIILDIAGFILPITSSSALPNDSVISGKMHQNISYDGTISGLYTADFSQGAPPSVGLITAAGSQLPSDRIQALEAYNNTVYVGTDNGLALLSLIDNSWTIYNTSNSNLPSNDVVALAVDPNGRFWVATSDNNVSTLSVGIGISEPSTQHPELTLYPNPVTDHLIMKEYHLGNSYEIRGIDGKLIQRGEIDDLRLELSSLENGPYLFVMTSPEGVSASTKLVKK